MSDIDKNSELYKLVFQTPVSQVPSSQLEELIEAFSKSMLCMECGSPEPRGVDLEKYYEGSHILFMKNAVNHPDSSASQIADMCIKQSINHANDVDHLDKCWDS